MEHVASAVQGASPEQVLAAIRAENDATAATLERPATQRRVRAADHGADGAAGRGARSRSRVRGIPSAEAADRFALGRSRPCRRPRAARGAGAGQLQPVRLDRRQPAGRVRVRRARDQAGGAHAAHRHAEVATGRRGAGRGRLRGARREGALRLGEPRRRGQARGATPARLRDERQGRVPRRSVLPAALARRTCCSPR